MLNQPEPRLLTPRALIACSFLLALCGAWLFYGITIDDAYISARYTRNLVHGQGLTFNLGERVEGYSNPSWVFLTGSLSALFGTEHLMLIGRICGLLATLCAIFYAIALMLRMGCSQWAIALTTLLLAALPQVSFWSVAGLETTFYGLVMLLGAGLVENSPGLAGLVCGVSALTRPEGALLFISNIFGNFSLAKNTCSNTIAKYTPYVVAFVVIFGSYFLFRIFYFGTYVPNTYLVKAGGVNKIIQGIWYVKNSLTPGSLLLLLLALPAIILERKNATVRCIALALLGEFFFTVWAGGDWMPQGRFLIPVFFLATPLAGISIDRFLPLIDSSQTRWTKMAAVVVMATIGVLQARDFYQVHDSYYWRIAHGLDSRIALGKWLRVNTPSNLVIAYGDMGALPYFSDRKFIDFHGLVDHEIASVRHELKNRNLYLRKIDEIIIARNPDLIITISHATSSDKNWDMPEYGTEVLKDAVSEKYVMQGRLTAYPPGLSKEYPQGRYLVIYARRGIFLPGLAKFIECSNLNVISGELQQCTETLRHHDQPGT